MTRLISAILSRTESPGTPRGKIASSRIFAFGKSLRSSSTTAPTPSAISGPVAVPALLVPPVLLVPIISITALGWKPWPSPFFSPHRTPCVVSPEIAKLAVLIPPKYLSYIALFASGDCQKSVMESPSRSRSMSPFLAISTKPSCLGPCRWAVCVYVAATFRRGGCSRSNDSYFFSSGLADDLSESTSFLSASLTCVSSAAVGRGIATSGGTGAGGPITTTGSGPRPCAGAAGAAGPPLVPCPAAGAVDEVGGAPCAQAMLDHTLTNTELTTS